MRSVADRLALAEHIQAQWYPQRTGAWLKAVPVAALQQFVGGLERRKP